MIRPPTDWTRSELAELGPIRRGISYTAAQLVTNDAGVPYVNMKCFCKGGGFSARGLKYFGGPYTDDDLVTDRHLLIVNTDVTRDGDIIGVPAILPDALVGGDALCSHHVTSIDLGDSADVRFLHYLLCLGEYRSRMRTIARGTTVLMLDPTALGLIEVHLPPPPEQSKIAEVLSTVDQAIEQTEALIAKQQRIKTGLMQDLLTRGIDENGNLRSEETHEFKDSPLGRIPVQWDVIDFGDAGDWFSGGTPSKANSRFWNGGVPWVCPKDMKQFELSSSIDTITEYAVTTGTRLMPVGTVFIVIRGMILAHTFPVGYSTSDIAFNQDVKAIVTKSGLDARFLAYWLVSHSRNFLKLATTATHGTKRFDMDELYAAPIGVPLPIEQDSIVRVFDEQQTLIDRTQAHAAKLHSLKTGLMQDLLTGKVRVTPLLEKQREAVTA